MTLQQIAMNPTAWASAGQQFDPLRASSLAINALQAGAQESRAKESFAMAKEERAATKAEQMAIKAKIQESLDLWRSGDRQGLRRSIGELSALDPQAAQGIAANFGTLDYQSFGESAYNVLSAGSINDPEGQNKLLANARDIIAGSNPQHPFVAQIDQLMRMPPGKEKDEGIFKAVEFAKMIAPNLFGGAGGKGGMEKGTFQKTPADIYFDEEKKRYVKRIDIMDSRTGEFTTKEFVQPKDYTPIGDESLTPEQKTMIKEERAEKERLAKGKAEVAINVIDAGRLSSDAMPTIQRSIDLLNIVKSGGWQAAIQPAKNFFNVTGANEGELTYNLGQQVLKQLKPTFGGAFSVKEGDWLQRIEAGFGKNPEVNKRLLNQLYTRLKFKAEAAIKRAEETGDFTTADEIRSAMQLSLSPSDGGVGQGIKNATDKKKEADKIFEGF